MDLRNHRRWRSSTFVSLLLALALVGAACSGSTDTTTTEGSDTTTGGSDTTMADDATTTSTAEGDSTSTTEDMATGEPQRGGKLVIGIPDESALGFDPSTGAHGPGGRTIALAIYDTPTAFAPDGSVVPYLAESVDSNDDFTQWTMTVREGMTFHDGTPVNAEAIKWTFDANDAAGRPLDPGYSTEVVDEMTIQFDFEAPYGTFESAMATQFAWIKSPTAEQELGEEFTNNPVGSGPYVFEEWVRDDHLILLRNEDYWRDDVALLDEVEFRVIVDDAVRLAALEAGDIDAMVVGAGDIATLRDSEFQMVEVSSGVNSIVLNNSIAPFDDVRVRRALSHAIDRQALIDSVWDGVGVPATSPIPHDNPFYSEPEGFPGYDPDEAARLISEYESETGTEVAFALTFTNTPIAQEQAQLVQAYWQAVGVDVELAAPVPTTDLLNILSTHEYEAAINAIEGFLDPDIWNYYLFHSSSFLNLGAISIPSIDDALDRGHRNADMDVRMEAYADYQQALADETPWIFIRDQVQAVAARQGVEGLEGWTLPDGSPGIYKQFWVPFTVDSIWLSE